MNPKNQIINSLLENNTQTIPIIGNLCYKTMLQCFEIKHFEVKYYEIKEHWFSGQKGDTNAHAINENLKIRTGIALQFNLRLH